MSAVTIRTSEETGENVINITLEVVNGEIVNMSGQDETGNSWSVESIKFRCTQGITNALADRCCVKQGGIVRCFEC